MRDSEMKKIPFDLEKFCAGAVAIDLDGREVRFARSDCDGDIITDTCDFVMRAAVLQGTSHANGWTMKPTAVQVADDDGWIPHNGSDICPIPGVKAGEWEQEFDRGWGRKLRRTTATDADETCWKNVKRWRMLNGKSMGPAEIRSSSDLKEWDAIFEGLKKRAIKTEAFALLKIYIKDKYYPEAPREKPFNVSSALSEAIAFERDRTGARRGPLVEVRNDALNALRWK